MKILVVTATRGNGQWFPYTLKTITFLKQQRVPLVWVVIGPPTVAEEIGRMPEVDYVFSEQCPGFYGAMNQAITAMSFLDWTHFTYINDDDGLAPGFSDLCGMAKSGEFDVYYGNINFIDASGGVVGAVSIARNPKDCLPLLSRGIAPFSQQGMLMKRDLLERAGLFDLRFSHVADAFLWVRCFELGACFSYVPALCAYYRIRPGQLSNAVELMHDQNELVTRHASKLRKISGYEFYLALFRFRVFNLRNILGRVARVGFRSSRSMFKHGVKVR